MIFSGIWYFQRLMKTMFEQLALVPKIAFGTKASYPNATEIDTVITKRRSLFSDNNESTEERG